MTTVPSWARVCDPLAPYADGFRVELERLGYTPLTAAVHVRLMAHLSRWLAREGIEVSGLTPAMVDMYFAERRAAGYAGHVTGRALQPRERVVVPDAIQVGCAECVSRGAIALLRSAGCRQAQEAGQGEHAQPAPNRLQIHA